jgi:hypothetical protein
MLENALLARTYLLSHRATSTALAGTGKESRIEEAM